METRLVDELQNNSDDMNPERDSSQGTQRTPEWPNLGPKAKADDARVMCDLCNKRFVNINALRMHKRNAKAHRPSLASDKSNISQSPYPEKGKPKEHFVRSTVSSGTKVDPAASFSCIICNRPFKTANGLRDHMNATTSKEHKAKSPLRPLVSDDPTLSQTLSQPSPFLVPDPALTGKAVDTISTVPASNTGDVTVAMERDSSLVYASSNGWSILPPEERTSLLVTLQEKCHSPANLSKNGYRIYPLSPVEIDETRKCENCGVIKRLVVYKSNTVCRFHPVQKDYEKGVIRGPGKSAKGMKCPCCEKKGDLPGCQELAKHHFVRAEPKLSRLSESPHPRSGSCAAIVLDCEMVGSLIGPNVMINDLIRLCAVDFLTGEVLVDKFVSPEHQVAQWRTSVSGVTAHQLREMKEKGRVVNSWKAARSMLYHYVDTNTVLIGHSLENDLAALGMVHTKVVDTAILTKDAVICKRLWSLKTLCQKFLGRAIQTGSKGHDCMEDTFATRELLLCCLRHPDQLMAWAQVERGIIRKEKEKEKERRLAKENESK